MVSIIHFVRTTGSLGEGIFGHARGALGDLVGDQEFIDDLVKQSFPEVSGTFPHITQLYQDVQDHPPSCILKTTSLVLNWCYRFVRHTHNKVA